VRGGLIDLFPMGSALPYRIDLFDNEIESIKTFDVDTQRTLYPVRDVRCFRRASSRSTTRDARAFAAASAKCSRATRRSRHSTRT
jgi:transcription-repair coupling factor (superfamily II helicase)